MATVAIVAHSRAGNTWRLAEAVRDGACIADAQVHLIRIDEEGIVDGAGWKRWPSPMASSSLLDPPHGRTLLAIQTFRRCHDWQPEAHPVARQTRRRVHQLDRTQRRQVLHPDVLLDAGDATGHGVDRLRHETRHRLRQGRPSRKPERRIGGYGGAMATNLFDDPQDMSPADLATAAAFGQRFATFLAAGKTLNTPYVDFTKNERHRVTAHAWRGWRLGSVGSVAPVTSGERPTRRRITARGEATRARMISAAADLMYVRGVNAVALDDVRAATGTSKSQLYKHFPDG